MTLHPTSAERASTASTNGVSATDAKSAPAKKQKKTKVQKEEKEDEAVLKMKDDMARQSRLGAQLLQQLSVQSGQLHELHQTLSQQAASHQAELKDQWESLSKQTSDQQAALARQAEQLAEQSAKEQEVFSEHCQELSRQTTAEQLVLKEHCQRLVAEHAESMALSQKLAEQHATRTADLQRQLTAEQERQEKILTLTLENIGHRSERQQTELAAKQAEELRALQLALDEQMKAQEQGRRVQEEHERQFSEQQKLLSSLNAQLEQTEKQRLSSLKVSEHQGALHEMLSTQLSPKTEEEEEEEEEEDGCKKIYDRNLW